VKEFQDQVVLHLRSIIAEGVHVLIVQNIGADHNLHDPRTAYIIMNSVKLLTSRSSATQGIHSSAAVFASRTGGTFSVLNSTSASSAAATAYGNGTGYVSKRPPSFSLAKDLTLGASHTQNQVHIFHYSVPFTLTGKNHAKSIDEQWMRNTILTVKDPFPYVLTRQSVCSREVRTYSPIEVAVCDIEDRIESMESELDKVIRNPSDCNNLMRIVQGTVLPQVSWFAVFVFCF
jgi:hypothetical protein